MTEKKIFIYLFESDCLCSKMKEQFSREKFLRDQLGSHATMGKVSVTSRGIFHLGLNSKLEQKTLSKYQIFFKSDAILALHSLLQSPKCFRMASF